MERLFHITGGVQRHANFSPDLRASVLDRLADAELQLGHHHAAEHLATLAAELRQVAS